jgi:hypothetical protein
MERRQPAAPAILSALCLTLAATCGATTRAATCVPSSTSLCLAGGRFSASVEWRDFQDNTGSGHAVALTSDTGYFWFFTSTNVELVVKVLDGRALNGHFWVFYGALSNVEYTMTVRDLATGDVRIYENPSGQFASAGDTTAFPPDTIASAASRLSSGARPLGRAPVPESALAPSAPDAAAACAPSPTSLCLGGGRFRVSAAWKDFAGNTGDGQAVALTTDTGYFWFFSSNNVEVVVKALDGRVLNDHFWVFYGALSNVEYTLTVTDTATGVGKTYENASGLFASVGDVAAFGQPTTFQLIDGAVVKGEIGPDTALLYKVYAYFGDPRLPAAYAGKSPGNLEHGIPADVVTRWSTLSPAAQAALEPFLTPPIYAGSWFAGRGSPAAKRTSSPSADWTRIETARSAVWYRAADAGAQVAAQNVAAEIEKVWDAEKNLMGREPLTDAGRNNNGGDGKLDIYVLPSFRTPDPTDEPEGMTVPYRDVLDLLPGDPPNIERAAYVLVRASAAATPVGARALVSHEFFHVIAFNGRYSGGITPWLNEAMATWMEDYVYPRQILDQEHIFGGFYFTDSYREKLDEPTRGGYEDYLFFFYLARKLQPEVNRDVWNNLASKPALDAIDAAIPGGFKERWPEFAMYCWDQPGVDQFDQWDSIASGLVPAAAEPYLPYTEPKAQGDELPARVVPHLSMRYAYVQVATDEVKRLEIQTPQVVGNAAGAKTQAWISLADGTTRVEDWTAKDRVVFCREKPSENVSKVMILYTNSSTRLPAVWGSGKVIADPVQCGGFRGTVRESRHGTTPDGTTASETMDVTARFLPSLLPNTYYLAQISMRYSITASNSFTGCTLTVDPVTQSASFAEDDGIQRIVFDKSTQPPSYSAEGNWGFIASARSQCSGQPGATVPTGVGGEWWKTPSPGLLRVNPDGSLSGDYTESANGVTIRWIWSLQPD